MKTCTKCGIEKPLSDYHVHSRTKDGLRSKCKECRRESKVRYYNNNKEKLLADSGEWRRLNKRHKSLYQQEWIKLNPDKVKSHRAKRRAEKLNAITPTTCLSTIKDIYKNCPEGYHVDHIVPLAKKGKHHQDNLCYLPASLNASKGAKILEDYPELLKQFNEQVIYPNIKA